MALRKIINWLTGRAEDPASAPSSEPESAPACDTPPAREKPRVPAPERTRAAAPGAAPAPIALDGKPFSAVISTPDYFKNEHAILRDMFEAGLTRFHLRKSRFSFREWCEWVEAVPEKWYDRIVIHNQCRIAEKFGLGGLHLRAGNRPPEGFPEEIPLSYSCSNFDDMTRSRRATYLSLGPVFPTEDNASRYRRDNRDDRNGRDGRDGRDNRDRRDSEPQRTPEEYAVILESWRENPRHCPVLALGGVTADNVGRARELGFDGFAVVGSVWDAGDPAAGFRALLKGWGGK